MAFTKIFNKKIKNYFSKLNISSGFSLIEALVVIAIIGIIAAIGVASFSNTANDANFKKGNILTETFIEEIKSKAFADNRPYKIYIENNSEGVQLDVYGPSGTAWFDPNLVRRCNCQVGSSTVSGCSNVFLNTIIEDERIIRKNIQGVKVKTCDNASCDTEADETVELCLLSNGNSPRTIYFKLEDLKTNNSKIKTLYNTGYVK